MIKSLIEFMAAIQSLERKFGSTVFFRGHGREEYKLLPKAFRQMGWESEEHVLLRSLISMQPDEFINDSSTLDKLVRAQHFGLPTRLLDVTLNPLVALYFSCREAQGEDGEVVVLGFDVERVKSFDSDTVSVIANTALLSFDEKQSIDRTVAAHFSNAPRLSTSAFNDKAPLPRLLHFIQAEKPYFKSKMLPQAFRQYVVVLSKRNNKRMIAQSGAFVAFAAN